MTVWLCRLLVVSALYSASAGITMPARRPQPMYPTRMAAGPVIRVRSGPVKRIYVPMAPQHQRFLSPSHWKQRPLKMYHVPQAPNRITGQPWGGPMRKGRNPKPKYARKPVYKYPKVTPTYDNYKPQAVYNAPVISDSYGAPKTSYQLTAPTYGKPHPAGSPEPPKDKINEETPTSYMHVYQGEKATKEGKPTYGYTQSHTTYEDTIKTSSSKATNHRPVYKPKVEATEDSKQGSFQPPKQTYGFTPYEESQKESSASYSPAYYKKEQDTVLSPNYFDQSKS